MLVVHAVIGGQHQRPRPRRRARRHSGPSWRRRRSRPPSRARPCAARSRWSRDTSGPAARASRSETPAAKTNSRQIGRIDVRQRHADAREHIVDAVLVPRVALSAFSDENAMARPLAMSRPLPSSARSLSLAVTTATLAPASWNACMMVGARRNRVVHHHFLARSRGSKK